MGQCKAWKISLIYKPSQTCLHGVVVSSLLCNPLLAGLFPGSTNNAWILFLKSISRLKREPHGAFSTCENAPRRRQAHWRRRGYHPQECSAAGGDKMAAAQVAQRPPVANCRNATQGANKAEKSTINRHPCSLSSGRQNTAAVVSLNISRRISRLLGALRNCRH